MTSLPETHTVTTGTGTCVLENPAPEMAKIYKIEEESLGLWEIGHVLRATPKGFMPSLIRCPIVSSNGIGEPVSFPSGTKTVHFSEDIPKWLAEVSRVMSYGSHHEHEERIWP